MLGDDVFSKEIAFEEGMEELCVGRETSCGKSALGRVSAGLGAPSQHAEVCNPPWGRPRLGHGGAEPLGLQLRVRGLHVEKVDQAGAGGQERPGAVAGRQRVVFIPQRPRVNRVGLRLQGEDVLEGRGGAGSAVGVPHGEGDGAGTGLPRAPAAGQVFAHGPLEVPHEERVDDGVHGAVAVPEPGEHVEEAGRDTAADCLRGGHSKGEQRLPPRPPSRGFPRDANVFLSKEPFKTLTEGLLPGEIWSFQQDLWASEIQPRWVQS